MVLSSLSFQKLKNIIILNCFKMGSSNLPSHHTITFFFEKTTLKIRNIDPVSKVLYNYIKQAQRTPIPGTKICGSYKVMSHVVFESSLISAEESGVTLKALGHNYAVNQELHMGWKRKLTKKESFYSIQNYGFYTCSNYFILWKPALRKMVYRVKTTKCKVTSFVICFYSKNITTF